MSIKSISSLLIYLFINSLFTIKYTSQLGGYLNIVFCLVYIFVIIFSAVFYIRSTYNNKTYKYLFWGLSLSFFLFTILLNIHVEAYALNVDRWSAMDVAVDAMLNGKYPYSAEDHLGGRTSNFPSLLFIGIPFHLLGDVGYLQSLSFILFIIAVFLFFNDYKARCLCLILSILSISYLWEIYVKSDLMSNFIGILLFMVAAANKVSSNNKGDIRLISFFTAILTLTRCTVVIPLSLFLFKRFITYTNKEKLTFTFIFILTISVFSFISFHNVENWSEFITYNPIELQNRQLPTLVSIIIIILPFFFSFKITNQIMLLKACVYFLLLPTVISFVIQCYRFGIYNVIYESSFDISYFNMCMPFLLFVITSSFSLKKE